jgi:hypothetical protein
MANVDKAFGLRPLGNLSATGAQKQYGYTIEAGSGDIFQGDLVTVYDGYLVQFDPSTHTAAVGVFNGCNYVDPTTGKPIWRNNWQGASVDAQADVLDDPNQLFIIQSAGTVAQADIGKNADVVVGSGNTTTGVSGMEISGSMANNDPDLNLKIIGLYDQPGNSFGANAVVVVKINEHLYGSTGVAGQGA